MWMLATALSSQFDRYRELFYTEAKQMLEGLDLTDDDVRPVQIEQVQSWLLIAFYEFARCGHHRACISAGRAFRLAQMARLHEIDNPDGPVNDEDPIQKEERRRTFWVAYCLDRLICMGNRTPLTLTEDVVSPCVSVCCTARSTVLHST